jgi:UDP-glucose 4-epimerase
MLTKKILITGGAGFIGSHMAAYVARAGYTPVILDDFSTGHRAACADFKCVTGSIHDAELLRELFAAEDFSAVMHFASFIQVGESVKDPAKYYFNNVAGTLTLLRAMLEAGVNYFIFSSSAAVYGEPDYTPIDESHRIAPINPYGYSKWMIEQVLSDYAASYALKYCALRYFNAAGADAENGLGECHDPETHLIPLILQVANNQREAITVFGNDYPTEDGTCVRDYIHVNDLCEAHWLALQALWDGAESKSYNLGTGIGYTVQQVIDVARSVTQAVIPTVIGKRRAGDPAVLVADPSRAMAELNWIPKYSDLKTIVTDAWKFKVGWVERSETQQ